MPESFETGCGCTININSQAPTIAPYVVSVAGLNGIISLDGTGVLDISTSGNTIVFGLSAGSGLGSVTSVNASSSNSNLTVAGGPITTNGTFTFNLAGALASISGLVTAADKMIYTTALDTYAVTDLTAFARTILDDANQGAVQSTLGLVIGTNVQAWNADLDSFVTNSSYSGSSLTLTGAQLTVEDFVANGTGSFGGVVTMSSSLSVGTSVTAATFSGDGSALTALNASNVSTGTLAVARGGTNISSYAVGDLIYASGATTLAKLADVAAGAYLRSGGVTTAPVWSTLILPNAATAGDIFMATSANTMGRLANVATGNALLSGGVGTASAFGKVTSSHVDSTIATLSAGTNSNILIMSALGGVTSSVVFSLDVTLNAELFDSVGNPGAAGNILSSTGVATEWTSQVTLDTLTLNTSLSLEATITAGGTTGDQTINKLAGSVNFGIGASSLVVTDSLVTANSIIICTVLTNDTTALIKNVVATSGAFTIRLNAAATAETKVGFIVIQPS